MSDNNYFQDKLLKTLPSVFTDEDDGTLEHYVNSFAISLDDVKNIIDNFSEIFDVDNCNKKYLPYLAEMVGWPLYAQDNTQNQRTQIKQAADVFKLKGMEEAIQTLMYGLGFRAEVTDLWTYDYETFSEFHGPTIYRLEGSGGERGMRYYREDVYLDDEFTTNNLDPLWYKSPHFMLKLYFSGGQNALIEIDNDILQYIKERVELVRPAHTVISAIEFIIEFLEERIVATERIRPSYHTADFIRWPYCFRRYRGEDIEYIRDGLILTNRDGYQNYTVWKHKRYPQQWDDDELRGDFEYLFYLQLNGVDKTAYINHGTIVGWDNIVNEFTVSSNVLPTSLTLSDRFVMSTLNSSKDDGTFGWGIDNDNVFLILISSGGSVCRVDTTGSPMVGTESQEIKISFDGSTTTVKIYVDGVEEATNITGSIPSQLKSLSQNFYLGSNLGTNGFFQGNIHDPCISDSAQLNTDPITNRVSEWKMTWINFNDTAGSNSLTGVNINYTVNYGDFIYLSGLPIRFCDDVGDLFNVQLTGQFEDIKTGAHGIRDGHVEARDATLTESGFHQTRGDDVGFYDSLVVTVTEAP